MKEIALLIGIVRAVMGFEINIESRKQFSTNFQFCYIVFR